MILLFISALSPLIPLIIGGIRKQFGLLWIYSLFSIVADLSTMFWKRVMHFPNSISGNLFALAEFILLMFFYRNKVFSKNTLFLSLLYSGVIFFILSATFINGWLSLNRVGICVFWVVYITLSLFGFYTTLKQQKIMFLERSSFFWANTTILIYSSTTFFLFLATIHIKSNADKVALAHLWGTLFLSLNILKNILLGIALSKKADS